MCHEEKFIEKSEVCIDFDHGVVSVPSFYSSQNNFHHVQKGVAKMVEEVIRMIKK